MDWVQLCVMGLEVGWWVRQLTDTKRTTDLGENGGVFATVAELVDVPSHP